MAREILCPVPHMFVRSLISGTIRLRLSNSSLERYETCLVACNFYQEHGHDCDETFAPVAHITTVRTLLIVAFVQAWSIS
jgi:hypothetical protein